MKKLINRKFPNIILDKFLLLVTAVLVGVAMVGGFALLDYYHFSKGWSFFIYLNIAQFVIAITLCLPSLKKAKNKKLGFMLLMAIEIFEIAALFSLCYFGIFLVEHLLGMGTIVFGIPLLITVSLFNVLLKYFRI